jgi:poly-gamma-glutamate synthesis protein (capsule biosynthesis protein)
VHDQARADAVAVGATGYDFGPMLAGIGAQVAAADLAICHLETMLSLNSSRLSGYPRFLVPFELADAIAGAGYDACSVASNHALDRGAAGMVSTLVHLDRAGVGHAGGARSPEEQATPSIYDANGVRVGHLSYSYGFNGLPLPADAPWTANRLDLAAILAEAGRARAAGAEFVVLSLHWGAEYRHEPTAEQQAIAAGLLASPDIDLIIGHHAHVVQPVAWVGDELVVYGMGNLLSNQRNSQRLGTQEGVLVTLQVQERPAGGFAVVGVTAAPTFVEIPGHRVVPTSPTLHPDSYQRVLAELGPAASPPP